LDFIKSLYLYYEKIGLVETEMDGIVGLAQGLVLVLVLLVLSVMFQFLL